MFLGLLDPHPDPYCTCTDPDPDPSVKKKKMKKTLVFYDFYRFVNKHKNSEKNELFLLAS
jgi:hypothetical protein